MTAYRIELRPRSPIHRGIHGHASKSGAAVHSDTLHAALMAAAALDGGMDLDALRALRLSSLFPCWRGMDFYPKPFLPDRKSVV